MYFWQRRAILFNDREENKMRIDKFLKVSRLDQGRVKVNDRVVKSSYDVKVGDVIEIGFGTKQLKARVLDLRETTKKAEASDLYELID